jgi:hypothetical protein
MKVKIDYKKLHKGMWEWLAKNPKKEKCQWPGFRTIHKLGFSIPDNDCFACEFTGSKGRIDGDCKKCPVDFGIEKTSYNCENKNSYYQLWKHKTNRVKNANLIANGWK